MPNHLSEGLVKRAAQWEAFHAWEQSRTDIGLTLEERIAWYAAAFDFVRDSLGMAITAEKNDKTNLVRNLHARLKHLKRSGRNG